MDDGSPRATDGGGAARDAPPGEGPEGAPAGSVTVPGRATLFGYDPTTVTLTLLPRGRRWRTLAVVRIAAVAVVLAPLAAIVPPHAPWALGVLGVAGLLIHRRLQEGFTVARAVGPCPKCGGRLSAAGGRLRAPHPAACESCHNEFGIAVDAAAVEAHGVD